MSPLSLQTSHQDAILWSRVVPIYYIGLVPFSNIVSIIFGPDDAEPMLGVVALENVGIAVDPVTKTLKRMAAKALK